MFTKTILYVVEDPGPIVHILEEGVAFRFSSTNWRIKGIFLPNTFPVLTPLRGIVPELINHPPSKSFSISPKKPLTLHNKVIVLENGYVEINNNQI